jgi:hypothetical protein
MLNALSILLTTISLINVKSLFVIQKLVLVKLKVIPRPIVSNANKAANQVPIVKLLHALGLEQLINAKELQRIAMIKNLAPLIHAMLRLEIAFMNTNAIHMTVIPTLTVLLGDKLTNFLLNV